MLDDERQVSEDLCLLLAINYYLSIYWPLAYQSNRLTLPLLDAGSSLQMAAVDCCWPRVTDTDVYRSYTSRRRSLATGSRSLIGGGIVAVANRQVAAAADDSGFRSRTSLLP